MFLAKDLFLIGWEMIEEKKSNFFFQLAFEKLELNSWKVICTWIRNKPNKTLIKRLEILTDSESEQTR